MKSPFSLHVKPVKGFMGTSSDIHEHEDCSFLVSAIVSYKNHSQSIPFERGPVKHGLGLNRRNLNVLPKICKVCV